MLVLVTYDVNTETKEGRTRLRRIARICMNYGQRVQHSVFECFLEPAQWVEMRGKLEKVLNEEEDSLRYYYLGKNWKRCVEHVGAKPGYNPEGTLVV